MAADILSRLIPKPQRSAPGKGIFGWSHNITLICEPGNEADLFAAQTLLKACAERGLDIPRIAPTQDFVEAQKPGCILLGDPARNWPLLKALEAAEVEVPAEIVNQGYVLHVSAERILLASYTNEGVYYGVQTLIQMLPRAEEAGIPAIRIDDWTTLPQRGISLDLFSGEVYSLEMFKECVRRLAHYKMNLLVPYFEDAFEFPSHPDIGEGRDRMTFAEAQALVAFARKHHVEIIPCYDSPGHIGHTLRHPNYKYLQEGDKEPSIINVTHPDTYPLLRDLYGDLCKAFPASVMYVSGDEAVAIGRGKSKAILDEVGAENLFLRHAKILRDFLKDKGKRIALAGDPFEPDFFKAFGLTNYGLECLKKLPKDIIIGPWHYTKVSEFPFGKQLKDMGYDSYYWTSNQAFRRLYPPQNAGAINVESFVPFAHENKALGAVHSDWNLPEEFTFSEYNWLSNFHFAEWAWNRKGRKWDDLLPLMIENFYGPGTAPLSKTIGYLSNFIHYFRWADPGWGEPEFKLFFKPLEPEELDEKNFALLLDFRKDWQGARDGFNQAKSAAQFHADHLDYYDFCLDQCLILADLIESRHLMAKVMADGNSAEAKNRLRELLGKLSTEFPKIMERYNALWHRTSKPLGLEDSKKHFEIVLGSIRKAAENR